MMITKHIRLGFFLLAASLLSCQQEKEANAEKQKPNIIFVMVDDMGYGDLGCFGQQVLKTPNIDKIAAEGVVFTQCYSGSTVCAPSRSTLMTGQHTGHTKVRGNFSQILLDLPNPNRVPLAEEDTTLAEVMKQGAYVTAMTGKWGLGEPATTGEPNQQGFDQWLGFLNQRRAHDHFPDYIWHNRDTFKLKGNDPVFNQSNVTFSHNLFTNFALDFIDNNRDTSFFLYLPYCIPHDYYHIPEEDLTEFKDKDWTHDEKVYAAMIAKIDQDMGRLLAKLQEHQLDSSTMVFFCSDNGAARRWEGRFNSSGSLRGRKRDMYEGGIRTAMIVRMPGTIPAGTKSEYPWYFPDVLPTLAELIEVKAPDNIDGISVLPEILGEGMPESNRFLYWEFHEGGFYQAVRWKNWKAVREGLDGKLELYDLSGDVSEENDVSRENPEIVKKIEDYLEGARSKSKYWKAK